MFGLPGLREVVLSFCLLCSPFGFLFVYFLCMYWNLRLGFFFNIFAFYRLKKKKTVWNSCIPTKAGFLSGKPGGERS